MRLKKILILSLLFLIGLGVYAESSTPLAIQCSPLMQWGTFDKEVAVFGGVQAGVLYDHWMFGGTFIRTITKHYWEMEPSEGDHAGLVFGMTRELIYGGGVVEYHFNTKSGTSPFLGVLIGGGQSRVGTISDEIFVLEPRIGISYGTQEWAAVSAAVGYRAGFFSDWFPYSWVSGFGCTFAVHISQPIGRLKSKKK